MNPIQRMIWNRKYGWIFRPLCWIRGHIWTVHEIVDEKAIQSVPCLRCGFITKERTERNALERKKRQEELELDAERYRMLRSMMSFRCTSYGDSPSGHLDEAKSSDWRLQTTSVFVGTNKEPESIDSAIDKHIEAYDDQAWMTCGHAVGD